MNCPFLGLNSDKMCCDIDNVGFGEDDDGVEDEGFGSVSVNSCSFSVYEDMRTEFERYKTLNDCTVDYEKLEHKLNATLGLLAQKDIDIKEGLKLKAYEILVVKEKHDELVKQSLLTKVYFEGPCQEITKMNEGIRSLDYEAV
ncbi:hypothetical protein Tco_0870338 [Tanacetum coccineum]